MKVTITLLTELLTKSYDISSPDKEIKDIARKARHYHEDLFSYDEFELRNAFFYWNKYKKGIPSVKELIETMENRKNHILIPTSLHLKCQYQDKDELAESRYWCWNKREPTENAWIEKEHAEMSTRQYSFTLTHHKVALCDWHHAVMRVKILGDGAGEAEWIKSNLHCAKNILTARA